MAANRDRLAAVFDLTGRAALVTGGSRGLGREMALGLARAGADVMIASRKAEACEAAAAEIAAATGRRVIGRGCHVGRWDELEPLLDAAYAELGRLDVLVNNAGSSPLYPDEVGVTEALFDKVVDVNLKGPFRLTALAGERMARDGGGSIVNVSSVAAVHATPGELPYAAAKAGLHALTTGFARAYGPAVRVNCVMPGAFLTDISKAWDMEAFGRRAEAFALERGGEPREIVGAVLYLASDASSYTTGAVLPVDGGYR
jgi:NAD(P)-dependent dehydrogenase (short-subunit alcohol dehydrogenase family)